MIDFTNHGTAFAAGLCAFALVLAPAPARSAAPEVSDVVTSYANIALAGYEDSLASARELKAAVDRLLDKPDSESLAAARDAWIAARVPYQQTEVYRFGNRIVDDWEGKVNAWPLDEGLIDYVAADYGSASAENALRTANVIASPQLRFGGRTIDASEITPALLAKDLHEAGNVEANVATGYHAVEFLLWGQDLNGTEPGAGDRPASDYDAGNCTNGNCERRAQYLRAATDLLIADLEWIVAQWGEEGAARRMLAEGGAERALSAIFTGLGGLTYGELAGERMKLGLLLHDPEEEHDCFSDNTHNSHFYNAAGIENVYLGRYERIDGSVVQGASVSDLVKARAPEIDARVRAALETTRSRMQAMKDRAEAGEAFDQMIGEGNPEGNAVVQGVIDALLSQAREFERAIAALELKPIAFEGSDSLDSPGIVLE